MPQLTEEQKEKLRRIQKGYEEPEEPNALESLFSKVKKTVESLSDKAPPSPTPQPNPMSKDEVAKNKLDKISKPFKRK